MTLLCDAMVLTITIPWHGLNTRWEAIGVVVPKWDRDQGYRHHYRWDCVTPLDEVEVHTEREARALTRTLREEAARAYPDITFSTSLAFHQVAHPKGLMYGRRKFPAWVVEGA